MKFGFKSYWKPTPVFMRQLGDSLLAAGTLAGTYGAVNSNAKYMLWVALGCIAGKFLTNLFGDVSLNDKANEPKQ